MRDCLFFVADKNMEGIVKGFFSRRKFHLSLKTRPFVVDLDQDIRVAVGKSDPGLFSSAKDLLQPLKSTYKHIVILIDSEWEGSPGSKIIEEKITSDLVGLGWRENDVCVVVVEPEVDKWMWTRTEHTATALGWASLAELERYTQSNGIWSKREVKPRRPKEAIEDVLRKKGKARSSSIYQKISSRISLTHCSDEPLLSLIKRIQIWFPQ